MPLIFITGILIGFSLNASAQETSSIPNWIKNTAKLWVNGDLGDADFIKAVQWMVTNGIIILPNNSQSTINSQMSAPSASQSNPLSTLLPTTDSIGNLWKILDFTSSSRFNLEASPPIAPSHTIEQVFEKTTATPMTVITIDIASFQSGGGLSHSDENEASRVYSIIKQDYEAHNTGYKTSAFIPNPLDSSAVCYQFTMTTTQSTKIDMFCAKGYTVFAVDATGNDLSMNGDVGKMVNLILPKLISY